MSTTTTTTRVDVHTRVTDQIVAMLEKGHRPWLQPWHSINAAGPVSRPLRSNGQPYSGINVLCLWIAAEEKGFACPWWITFSQAKELGGHVRKGEHGARVVYANTFTKTEQNDAGEDVEKQIPFLKEYTVFNAEQCEGLPQHFYARAQAVLTPKERIAHADAFFGKTGADIRHGGSRAFYDLGADYVQMPLFDAFADAESYASTLAHELAHWTRHESRLNRDLGRKKWGDEGYALEELVAELTAAYLCADLQITPVVREDHAAYISSWLRILRDDKRAIFTAASHATKAADFLHGLQGQEGGAD